MADGAHAPAHEVVAGRHPPAVVDARGEAGALRGDAGRDEARQGAAVEGAEALDGATLDALDALGRVGPRRVL